MGMLRYGDRSARYSLAETARLTAKIRIHVHPGGKIEIEAPVGGDRSLIRAAVQKRARWIFANLDAANETSAYASPREYVGGETHFYLGRRYRLAVKQASGKAGVKLAGAALRVTVPVADRTSIKQCLSRWYRERALDYFSRRLTLVAQEIDWLETVPRLKLTAMEHRWGSCSPSGSITLNPALIRAPRHCIDYVLIHEICHLKEHNHSKRFYALLTKHLPDWERTKVELDRLAELLLAA